MRNLVLNSIVVSSILFNSVASAGTILLMGIGIGAPGGGGGGCSNSLDFTQSCNSQYISLF